MPQIILKKKTAHLAGYTFFPRDVDHYKNTTSLWAALTTIKNTFFTEHLSLATFAEQI